jgi:hypothetical protein
MLKMADDPTLPLFGIKLILQLLPGPPQAHAGAAGYTSKAEIRSIAIATEYIISFMVICYKTNCGICQATNG